MIDKALLAAIKSKKRSVSLQAIYQAFNRIRQERSNAISKEEAAYLYAARLGIDIYKFLKSDNELRTRVMSLALQPGHRSSTRSIPKAKKLPTVKVLSIKGSNIGDPLLPARIIDDAKEMAEIYPLIYLFENSVRNFVRLAMDKAFPFGWWTEVRITGNVYRKAVSRREEEGRNLWHGSRSSTMLDYVDLEELESVISRNTETLTPYFKGLPKDLEWLKMKIKEIYPSRNIVAHCNPLSKHDIKRVEVICSDWQNQLPALKTKLEE